MEENNTIRIGLYCKRDGQVICLSPHRKKIFQEDYESLLKNLETQSGDFRYKEILALYRPGINPVRALYESLQASIFKYEDRTNFDNWVIDLFRNDRWLNQLLKALKRDCQTIKTFQSNNLINDEDVIEKLNILNNIRSDFIHYITVFKLMKEWNKDN